MGFSIGISLWVCFITMGELHAQVKDLVISSAEEYVYNQMTGVISLSLNNSLPGSHPIKTTGINHNKVCSYWNNFHYMTFDGNIFYFPGTCNYVFSSHCKSNYEDFIIQIRHSVVNNVLSHCRITMKIDVTLVEMIDHNVLVNGKLVDLPYSEPSLVIQKIGVYTKTMAKIGLVFLKKEDGSFQLQLDEKYANQTCGLCGDFNGSPLYNEFMMNDIQISEIEFGNLQKLDGPNEQCEDTEPPDWEDCADKDNICENILKGSSFASCNVVLDAKPYIDACIQDLCRCKKENHNSCHCSTFTEYSRQCIYNGGKPKNWRTNDLCPKLCPSNMEYQECGSPCSDSCSDPERVLTCDEYCMAGCFCPKGLILDDISNYECIPIEKCSCTYNGNIYFPGASYSTSCSTCTCFNGKWDCENRPCSATCAIEGGSHITTFDETRYDVHGDCIYVISKLCIESNFTVLADLRPCGRRETESCLRSVTIILNTGQTIEIKSLGDVYLNFMYIQLPVTTANFILFKPSPFFIIFNANFGLQIVVQTKPFLQLYLVLDASYKAKTCGLCGNFNDQQADDFQAINGVIEGTAAAFVNTWKTAADCKSVKNVLDDPCSLSVETEEYAKHWCGLLIATNGVFRPCHNFVNPSVYYKNCLADTCSCEKSEDCMCAALSSYARACAFKGVKIENVETIACSKYFTDCPKNLVFSFSITSCQPTCRSLSEPDITCNIHFDPLPGCTCKMGYYLDHSGKCVPAGSCPCYFRGIPIFSGETINESGTICTCTKGKLSCTPPSNSDCKDPMIYVSCDNERPDMKGSECLKSCQTLDMQCYNTRCVPGCVCPAGLVSDDKGGCIRETQCPCIHNGVIYQPGDSITVQCNTCVCKNRMWECTNIPCLRTCKVYGDGHYVTFDGNRYSFNGDCQYTLSQDHCSLDNDNSTFRIITENIPCGTTGMTCSKAIKVFLGSYELILADDHLNVVQRGIGKDVPYRVRLMGIYLVIEANHGLLLLWDKKTSIFIKVTNEFRGRLCGLCGNFDGNGNNDFTTRGNAVVGNIEEFGNSWKLNPACPDAKYWRNSCAMNPYRRSWAQKQCSIINSHAFSACHPHVDPSPYYEACVSDSCACNSGGDCECFCTAVAAYAQTCGEFGICISWRDPNTCPLFCDYYNSDEGCEWHYKPCGAPCMKTCRNPNGKCVFEIRGLEGCYPNCPKDKPFFDEDEMKCVSVCGCYDMDRKHYKLGASVPSTENCYVCNCTKDGIKCRYKVEECMCEYQSHMYKFNEIIYNITDRTGKCTTAICRENGTISTNTYRCTTSAVLQLNYSTTAMTETIPISSGGIVTTPTKVLTTKISTSTSEQPSTFPTTKKTTIFSTSPISQTTSCEPVCKWTVWFDQNPRTFGVNGGDSENYYNIINAGYHICGNPTDIQCRAHDFPDIPLEELGQDITCDLSVGLVCKNKGQLSYMQLCHNYEVRFLCCERNIHCTTVSPPTIRSTLSTPTTSITLPIQSQTPGTTSQTQPTVCQPKCIWTPWFNLNERSSGLNGGDSENYESVINSGKTICKLPTDIQCRAEEHPDTILEELQQTVQCDLSAGLVCENKDQLTNMGLCYNYEIRFLCCDDYSHCPTTPPTTATEVITIISSQTTPSFPVTQTLTQSSTTKSPGTSTTPFCNPRCTWTQWFDENIPSWQPDGGEFESYDKVIASGKYICKMPKDIECRPEKIVPGIIQNIKCDLSVGFICRNADQGLEELFCHNYEIRFLCCDYSHCATTSPSTTSLKVITSTSPPSSSSFPVTSTSPPSSSSFPVTSTSPPSSSSFPVTQTLTQSSTPESPGISTTPFCKPVCRWTQWFDENEPSWQPGGGDFESYDKVIASGKYVCRIPKDIQCRSQNTAPELTQKIQCDLSVGLVCRNIEQESEFTLCDNYQIRFLCCDDYSHCATTSSSTTATQVIITTPSPSTSTFTLTQTASVSSTTESTGTPTTPFCKPICTWTQWFDENEPSRQPGGGEFESYDKVIASGKSICKMPKDIECRPEKIVPELIQNIKCDLSVGFICRNADQGLEEPFCHNYEIRFLCCDYSHCATTSPSTTSLKVITSTSPPSSPSFPVTSTSPPSSSSLPVTSTSPPSSSSFRVTSTSPQPSSSFPVTSTSPPSSSSFPVTSTSPPSSSSFPVTSTSPPSSSSFPVTSTSPPSSSSFPVTSTSPPSSSSYPVTSTSPPSSSSFPVTSKSPPSSSSLPVTSTSPPSSSSFPVTSTSPPSSSSLPVTSTSPPSSSSLPVTSTSPPSSSSFPVTSTSPPSSSSFRVTSTSPQPSSSFPVTSTSPPSSSSFRVTSTSPPSSSSFPVTSTSPPSSSSFPVTSTSPPSSSSFPVTSTSPPSSSSFPVTSTSPPSSSSFPVTSKSPPSSSSLPVTSTSPPSSSSFPVTSTSPPSSSSLPVTSTSPPSSSSLPVTSTSPPSSSSFPVTSTSPPSSSSFPVTSTPPPSSSSFPVTSTSPPSSSSFPVTSTSPPSSSSFRVTSTSPPSSSSFRVTSTSPPSSSSFPVTSTSPPSSSSFPVTSTSPPSSSSFRVTSTSPPSSSSVRVTSTSPPSSSSFPVTSTSPPSSSSFPVTSTSPPSSSSFPVTSTSPPSSSSFPVTSTSPPSSSSFPVTSTSPPSSSSFPVTSTSPPLSASFPVTSTSPPSSSSFPVTSKSPPSSSSLPVTSTSPPSSSSFPVTSTSPPSSSSFPVTSTSPPSSSSFPVTSTSPPSSSSFPVTSTSPPSSSSFPVTSTSPPSSSSFPVTSTSPPSSSSFPVTSTSPPSSSSFRVTSTSPPSSLSFRVTSTSPPSSSSFPVTSTSPPSSSSFPVTSTPPPSSSSFPVTSTSPPSSSSFSVTNTSPPSSSSFPVTSTSPPSSSSFPVTQTLTQSSTPESPGTSTTPSEISTTSQKTYPTTKIISSTSQGFTTSSGKSSTQTLISPETVSATTTHVFTATAPTTSKEIITTKTTAVTSKIITASKSTQCYCLFEGSSLSPGDVVYNITDESGCNFYAICSIQCVIERFAGPCKSTTTFMSSSSLATTTTQTLSSAETSLSTISISTPSSQTSTTTKMVTTTIFEGCYPRKIGESWKVDNCMNATCVGNNYITYEVEKCPEAKLCANGFTPISISSADECCPKYECECICSVWSDQKHMTFDGVIYQEMDICVQILVEQIIPKYDDFRILSENSFCADTKNCSHKLWIYFQTNKVELKILTTANTTTKQIKFNDEIVSSGFSKNGITISSTGVYILVEIPSIGATIVYKDTVFNIKLPFSKFNNNTQGLCGTCNNNKEDDCRFPDGHITPNCTSMAPHWNTDKVPKVDCIPPRATPISTITCAPEILCDLITSEVFATCHPFVPPEKYYWTCLKDACITDTCEDLENYASLCLLKGVCIDWRKSTNSKCSFDCTYPKVYRACNIPYKDTCEISANGGEGLLTEGCECPPGTTLLNTSTDICVPTCTCVGPDGKPKKRGDVWISNCNTCICDRDTISVICTPIQCPKPTIFSCDKEAAILVEVIDENQPCCLKNECRCNISYCPLPQLQCEPGFILVTIHKEGDCCSSYECRPLDVCVVDGTIYQPGQNVSHGLDPCIMCECSDEKDTQTQLNRVKCKPKLCNKDCPKGYSYRLKEGECCGICEAQGCTLPLGNGTTIVIEANEEMWYDSSDKCSYYQCIQDNERYILIRIKISCPELNETDCSPGYEYQQTEEECCGHCIQVACALTLSDNSTKIMQPGEIWSHPDKPCDFYECIKIDDKFVVITKHTACPQTGCPLGFKKNINKCCGDTCVRDACVLEPEKRLLQPGETWTSPTNKCISYSCDSSFELLATRIVCPPFDSSTCKEGTVRTADNGCCQVCEQKVLKETCLKLSQSVIIKSDGCESQGPVELTYCSGSCNSTSRYSLTAHKMEDTCTCCKATETISKQVELSCPDGQKHSYSYVYVNECGCSSIECKNLI